MIGTMGFVITEEGHYFLEENVQFNPPANLGPCAAAITIEADNVCLSGCCHTLSQFRVGNVAVPNMIGIRIAPFVRNTVIEDISIVDFSALGIWVEYGVDGLTLEKVRLRDSGYNGGSCYPVLDGFNPAAQAFAAGGIAFGGVLAGDPWFTDPLNPVAPFDVDQYVRHVNFLPGVESTGHISEDSPLTRTSPRGNTVTFTKTIAGVGGANVDGGHFTKTYISDIRETTPVDFTNGSGGGTARAFTIANGVNLVLENVVGQNLASTLGQTVINVSPGNHIVFEECIAQDSELLSDVLFPSRGNVGQGAGGPLPNTPNAIASNDISYIRCVSQNIRAGPNVTGTQNVGLFPGGGFITGFNARGATNVVFDECQSIDIEGAGNMLTSGYHMTSNVDVSDSKAVHIRSRGVSEEDFEVNGVGFLIAPPPRNAGVPVNIDLSIAGTGKVILDRTHVLDAAIGYRIIDTNPAVPNATSVVIRDSTYVPTEIGDRSVVTSGVSLGGVIQGGINVFIN